MSASTEQHLVATDPVAQGPEAKESVDVSLARGTHAAGRQASLLRKSLEEDSLLNSRSVWLAICCYALAVTLVGLVGTGPGAAQLVLATCSALGVCVIGSFAARSVSQEGVAGSSLVVSSAIVTSGVVLPGAIVALSGYSVNPTLDTDLAEPTAGIWLIAVGMAAAAVGYLAPRLQLSESVRQDRRLELPRLRGLYLSALLILFANIAIRGRSIDGRVATLGFGIERLLSMLSIVMLFAVAAHSLSDRRADHLLGRFMVAGIALFGFAEGFFKPAFWALLVYSLAAMLRDGSGGERSLTVRSRALLGLGSIALLVLVVPIVQNSRTGDSEGISADLRSSYSETWGQGFSEGWSVFAEKALGRQAATLVGPTRVVARAPDTVPYKGYRELVATPTLIVPRAIWPGKPVLSTGTTVSVLFFDDRFDTQSSSTVTFYGDGYWFGGVLALVGVSLLGGALLGGLDASWRGGPWVVGRLAILPAAVLWETSFHEWSIGLLQTLAFVYLLANFASSPSAR